MSGFAATWLDLREPADRRARSASLLGKLAQRWAGRAALRIVDLGCGTGSTLRAVAPVLQATQHWDLLDGDPALLAALPERYDAPVAAHAGGLTLKTHLVDLNAGLEAALPPQADVIATSAFLDLVSVAWLDRLVAATSQRGADFYGALSYDGRIFCNPGHDDDDVIFAAFHHHMAGDKGFGASLGPGAASVAVRRFQAAGFVVHEAPADWQLAGSRDAALLQALLDGWYQAVAETGAIAAGQLMAWRQHHLANIAANALSVTIGHTDILACRPDQPPDRARS